MYSKSWTARILQCVHTSAVILGHPFSRLYEDISEKNLFCHLKYIGSGLLWCITLIDSTFMTWENDSNIQTSILNKFAISRNFDKERGILKWE